MTPLLKTKSPKKSKKGKITSGLYTKPGNTKLVTSEQYAHTALDGEIGGDKEIHSLSFNLFMAGELEIISDPSISQAERNTRTQVLKNLAYKNEILSKEDIIKQYVNFMRKIEKGRFRWGSKSALRQFEQQLLYNISVDRKDYKDKHKISQKKWEERKKYCLDYNRGTCTYSDSHEGKLNGVQVMKMHICRKCLINENKEVKHAEKDCKKA